MSTVRPEVEIALDQKVRAAVLPWSNAGRRHSGARRAKASCWALSAAKTPSGARPSVLEQMCRRVEHVGKIGAGASMKLGDQPAAAGLLAIPLRGAVR